MRFTTGKLFHFFAVISSVLFIGLMSCSENPSPTSGSNNGAECVFIRSVNSTNGEAILVISLNDNVYPLSESSSEVLGFNSSNWWTGTAGEKDDSLWVHEVSGVKKGKVYTFNFRGARFWADTNVMKKSQYWIGSIGSLAVKVNSDGSTSTATAAEVLGRPVANNDTLRVVDSVIVRIFIRDTINGNSVDTVFVIRNTTSIDSIFIRDPIFVRDTVYIDRTAATPFAIVSATALTNGNYDCVVGYSFRQAFRAVGSDYFEQGLPSWDNVFHALSSSLTTDSLRTIRVTLKNRTWYTTGYGGNRTQWANVPAGVRYSCNTMIKFWFEGGKAWEDSIPQGQATTTIVRDTIHDTTFINLGSPRIQAVKLLEVVALSNGTYNCRFGFLDTVITGWRNLSSFAEKGLPSWANPVSLNLPRTADGYRQAWITMPRYFHGTVGYYAVNGNVTIWADTGKLKYSDDWLPDQKLIGFDFYAGRKYPYGGVVFDTFTVNNRDSVRVYLPGRVDTLRLRDTTIITVRVKDTIRIQLPGHIDTVFVPFAVHDTTYRAGDTVMVVRTRVDTLRIIDQRVDTLRTTVIHIDTVFVPRDVIVTVDKDTVARLDTVVTPPVVVFLDPDSLIQATSRDSLIRRYSVVITNTTRNGVLTTRYDTLGGASITVIPFYRDTVNKAFRLVEVGDEGSGDHLLTFGLSDKIFKYSNPPENSVKMLGYKDDWTTGIVSVEHSNSMYIFRISRVKDGETFNVNFQGGSGAYAAQNILSRSQYFKIVSGVSGNLVFKFDGSANPHVIVKN